MRLRALPSVTFLCSALFLPGVSAQTPPCAYTLFHGRVAWAGAEAACQAVGLQLASVQSAAQNALLLTAASGYKVWMGGTDAASEGTWVWSPSNTLLSYINWAIDEPNNANGGEDCLEFHWNGKWNDGNCATESRFVCQTACPVPPSLPPPPPPRPALAAGHAAIAPAATRLAIRVQLE